MRTDRRLLRAALPLALLLAGGAVALPAPLARAEDGPGGEKPAEDLEAQIKAQMEKVVRLMRENEKALLEASVLGGRRPEGVDVKPPPGGTQGAGSAQPPPAGGTPPPQGEDARRKIEEVLRATQQRGGTIPGELENLVKMIPT
jgi:hypothetical protein